jgi:hypothetical protein
MATAKPKPAPTEAEQLKQIVRPVLRDQGNRFIKELLRNKGLPIGAKKDEFERNLAAAIDNGDLTRADVDEWLKSVEGWGNQHVYLYSVTDKLKLALDGVERKLRQTGLDALLNAPTTFEFPEQPKLTSISFDGAKLQLTWQEAGTDWEKAKNKEIRTETDGLDTYEYRPYRRLDNRSITRFTLRGKIAALTVGKAFDNKNHEAAIQQVREVLGSLLSLEELDRGAVPLGVVARKLDQEASNKKAPGVVARRSRLETNAGGSVEFDSGGEGAYWDDTALGDVRQAIRAAQIRKFRGAEGTFVFQPPMDGLSRSLRVQLYRQSNRVRLWAQMSEAEVWTILETLAKYQAG